MYYTFIRICGENLRISKQHYKTLQLHFKVMLPIWFRIQSCDFICYFPQLNPLCRLQKLVMTGSGQSKFSSLLFVAAVFFIISLSLSFPLSLSWFNLFSFVIFFGFRRVTNKSSCRRHLQISGWEKMQRQIDAYYSISWDAFHVSANLFLLFLLLFLIV